MPALADADDVQAIWRPLTDAELAVVLGQVRFASAIVRRRVPSVDARLAAGTLDADLVRGVVASMVKRALLNPDQNIEVAIDDMRLKKSDAVSGELYLSDDELALLRPNSLIGSTTGGAFSIRAPAAPYRSPGWFPGWFGASPAGPWVDAQGDPELFPWSP